MKNIGTKLPAVIALITFVIVGCSKLDEKLEDRLTLKQVEEATSGTTPDVTSLLTEAYATLREIHGSGADIMAEHTSDTWIAPDNGEGLIEDLTWNSTGQQCIYFGTSATPNSNVTDLTAVDSVYANITFPNQSSIILSNFENGLTSDNFDTNTENVTIIVNNGIYQPSRIKVEAGKKTSLQFLRKDGSPCAATVLLPEFEISEELPLDVNKTIDLPSMPPGEYLFHCPMKMYSGTLIVE